MMRAALAACTALWMGLGNTPAPAAEIELAPGEAYETAVASLLSGQPQLADGLADALLDRSPRDFNTLLLKSRTAIEMGKMREGLQAAQAAHVVADTDDEKYAASMAIAQALAKDGKDTFAQFWLRRAVDLAPDEVSRAQAVKDFRYVRARNPWSTELNFSISPTSNVNNGSRRETTRLYGLPFEFQLSGAAQALEGVEYSLGFATRYRVHQTDRTAHDFVFQFDHRSYVLSSEAKEQAPDVDGSDFALTQTSLGYVFRARPEHWIGPYELAAIGGYSWYGGEPYLSYVRLGGGQQYKLTDNTILSFSGSAERQYGENAPDADFLRGDIRLLRLVDGLGAVGFSVGRTVADSESEAVDYGEWRSGIDVSLKKPILGAKVRLGLEWSYRDYPESRYAPGEGRQDRTLEASVDFTFTQIERYGFNPTLTINGRSTDSNIGIYENEEVGVAFGIRSAF